MVLNNVIPFNKPFIVGNELEYIRQAVVNGKLSGNGAFTQKCQKFFESKYKIKKCLLTTSCTDALEMAAILGNIAPGDEVIVPSYTFVSTALAFIRQGANIIFADSNSLNPNIEISQLELLITERTKAIVVVHYAGIACDMDPILEIANRRNILVIEDAAQAIDSFYKGRPLGSIGHMSTFSFHETKNIISGEGGMLCINDERFIERAEIIWEKGTNRASFFRGEVNKYGWVDTGSSFLPSEVTAAFLYAQFERLEDIQNRRKEMWECYYTELLDLSQSGKISLPHIPEYATNNGHMFYIICLSLEQRINLVKKLKDNGIMAVFHYISLHSSEYYKDKYTGNELLESDRYTDCLLRLPMYYELTNDEIKRVATIIKNTI